MPLLYSTNESPKFTFQNLQGLRKYCVASANRLNLILPRLLLHLLLSLLLQLFVAAATAVTSATAGCSSSPCCCWLQRLQRQPVLLLAAVAGTASAGSSGSSPCCCLLLRPQTRHHKPNVRGEKHAKTSSNWYEIRLQFNFKS